MNERQSVYAVFYNQDDDLNVEVMLSLHYSLEGAKVAAQQEHEDYLDLTEQKANKLKWKLLKDWSTEAYEAFRDKWRERYFRIVLYGIQP